MSTYQIISSDAYIGDSRREAEPDTGSISFSSHRCKHINNPPGVIKAWYDKYTDDKKNSRLPSIVDIKEIGINYDAHPFGYPRELRYLQTSNGGHDSHTVHLRKFQPPSAFRHKRSPKSLRNTKQKSKVRSKRRYKVRSKGRSKQRRSRKM